MKGKERQDEKGNVDTSRQGIADTFATFHEQLYDSEVVKKESETIQNIQTPDDKIPLFSQKEVNEASTKLQKNIASEVQGVKVEMVENSWRAIREMFNEIITPEASPPDDCRSAPTVRSLGRRVHVLKTVCSCFVSANLRVCPLLVEWPLCATHETFLELKEPSDQKHDHTQLNVTSNSDVYESLSKIDTVAVSKLVDIANQRLMDRAIEFVIPSDETALLFSHQSDRTPALLQATHVAELSSGQSIVRKAGRAELLLQLMFLKSFDDSIMGRAYGRASLQPVTGFHSSKRSVTEVSRFLSGAQTGHC